MIKIRVKSKQLPVNVNQSQMSNKIGHMCRELNEAAILTLNEDIIFS